MEALRLILRQCRGFYRKIFQFGRRRFHRLRILTYSITILTIVFFVVVFEPKIFIGWIRRATNDHGRLYCILVATDPSHLRLLEYQNVSWTRHCHSVGIVKYRTIPKNDEELAKARAPYHVFLWHRILQSIRQTIPSYEWISNNDTLLIVPVSTYVFLKKLRILSEHLIKDFRVPSFIIHEQDDLNGYVLNGQALTRVRNSDLIETCLQKSYSSAREKHLWTCVKYLLRRDLFDVNCEENRCFVHFYRPTITLGHIKNGSCLKMNNRHQCQSVAFLYPATLSDLITLEFFKYRLKPKPTNLLYS